MIQVSEFYSKPLKEIDKLILKGVDLLNNDGNLNGENKNKFRYVEYILLDFLKKNTNFQSELQNLRISYLKGKWGFGTICFHLLSKLKKSRYRKMNFENFIKIFNKLIEEFKKKPIKNFEAYVPLKIKLDNLSSNNYKNLNYHINDLFGFKLTKSIPKSIKEEYKESLFLKLLNNRLIIKITGKARDSEFFLENNVNKHIDSFLGLIALIDNYMTQKISFGSYSLKLPIKKDVGEPPQCFVLFEENKITHPSEVVLIKLNDNLYKKQNDSFWKISNKGHGNFKNLIINLKRIKKRNKKIKELIFDYLKLYYNAIVEEEIPISFFKFWILLEKIIKSNGKLNDESIKSLLRKFIGDKKLSKRIDILYNNRNKLAHEFKISNITDNDRQITKLLCDVLLGSFINPIAGVKNINNVNDFKFMIDNVFISKKDLKSKINILKSILSKK